MPIYEYKCDSCGEVFEKRQTFADEPLTQHEKCGGPVHRLLSAPAFQFKGSGWYVTDYGKGNSSKSESHKSDSKSESKSDGDGAKSTPSESKSTSTETTTKSESKSDSSTK
jgi:putative FmdB family regulatory protein